MSGFDKVVEAESDSGSVWFMFESKAIKVDKELLASVSPVFKQQFFGPWASDLRDTTDVVKITDFTFECFEKLVSFINGESLDYFASDLLHLLKIADKYQMEDMFNKIKLELENIVLSEPEVMDVLSVLVLYENLAPFKDICEALMKKCATAVYANLGGVRDLLEYYKKHEDKPECLQKLFNGMVGFNHPPEKEKILMRRFRLLEGKCLNCTEMPCEKGNWVINRPVEFLAGLRVKLYSAAYEVGSDVYTIDDEDIVATTPLYNIFKYKGVNYKNYRAILKLRRGETVLRMDYVSTEKKLVFAC